MFSHCSETILKYVPEYRINLISPVTMSEEQIDKFRSDFRELATIIRCGRNRYAMQNIVEREERFRHLDPLTADLACSVTKNDLNLKTNEKGETNMCQAMREIREAERTEGRAEGRMEGRAEGAFSACLSNLKAIMSSLQFTAEQAMNVLNIPAEDRAKLLDALK